MDRFFRDDTGIVLGSFPLVLVEVIPLLSSEKNEEEEPAIISLSAPFVKLYLQELALRASTLEDQDSGIGIQWQFEKKKKDTNSASAASSSVDIPHQLRSGYLFSRHTTDHHAETTTSNTLPVMHLPSEHPLRIEPIPCRIIGYAKLHNDTEIIDPTSNHTAIVTDATLVRILPPHPVDDDVLSSTTTRSSSRPLHYHLLDQLVGEVPCSIISPELQDELIHNHNSETIQELTLRMSLQLAEPVRIGTTADALTRQQLQQRRRLGMARGIQSYYYCATKKRISNNNNNNNNRESVPSMNIAANNNNNNKHRLPDILRDGALLVHCPNHGSGKTALVQMIAQRRLRCSSVHVIQPGALLAKYGSQADAALESLLHAIALKAAVAGSSSNNNKICIVLDHLDTLMPPKLSGRSGAGDAAVPVLNAIASYLKMLILTLKKHREFPFPTKNPLYNIGGTGGEVLSVRICLVAIVTCPDDGWRSVQARSGGSDAMMGHATCILDALPLGRYRLPTSLAATRLEALEWAFQKEQVVLTDDAKKRLPLLAASAVWCRGSMFQTIAKRLRQVMEERVTNNSHDGNVTSSAAISSKDIEVAFNSIGKGTSVNADINFLAAGNDASQEEDPFGVVGGNSDAKRSLEDALALDARKRSLLNSMQMGTPIGVLLYGPPGCGKTLLAKAVARLLRSPGATSSHLGGAFVSLNSSDIVQAEVGSSEKLIVSTFQTARENAPSVIFIDEFQALFTERSRSGSGKLSSTLLQCMDDIKFFKDSNRKAAGIGTLGEPSDQSLDLTQEDNVVVLGATNTPWMVDKAFLRPGRFDRLVHVGLPSEKDRENVLLVHISKMKVKNEGGDIRSLCENISQRTQGFSGADLSALCRAAAVRCLLQDSDWVEERHFLQELNEGFAASSSDELVQRNEKWRH